MPRSVAEVLQHAGGRAARVAHYAPTPTAESDPTAGAAPPAAVLTAPGAIDAHVGRRIQDPSLLDGRSEPSYADFFSTPAV